MVLNNYIKAKAFFESHHNTFDASQYSLGYTNPGIQNDNGDTFNLVYITNTNQTYSELVARMYSIKEDLSYVVGTGTTTPVASDYQLENDITSSLSNYNYTQATSFEDGKCRTIVTITGTNNTGSSQTITEIGVRKRYYYAYIIPPTSVGENEHYDCLIIRHLLNTPKVVPDGEGFTITFQWDES